LQTYIKRGLQGRLRQASDDIGQQFSPDTADVSSSTSTTVTSDETVSGGVYGGGTADDSKPTTSTTTTQNQSRSASEKIGDLSGEKW